MTAFRHNGVVLQGPQFRALSVPSCYLLLRATFRVQGGEETLPSLPSLLSHTPNHPPLSAPISGIAQNANSLGVLITNHDKA